MLFLESKTLNHPLNTDARLTLLKDLQDRSLTPLIRSHRLRSFEDVLLNADRTTEMETALAASTESTTGEPYVRGDLFSFDDYILFLVFEDDDSIRAGIVYEATTPEPFRKLDSFCQDIRDLSEWESSPPAIPQGFRTNVERQDAVSLYPRLRKETMGKRILAASK